MRWPGQERMSLSSSPPPDSDELLGLLDVIHRKAVKLRAQQLVEAEWSQLGTAVGVPAAAGQQLSERKLSDKTRTLGAIHEHEVGSDKKDISSDSDTKDRVRRKIFNESQKIEKS